MENENLNYVHICCYCSDFWRSPAYTSRIGIHACYSDIFCIHLFSCHNFLDRFRPHFRCTCISCMNLQLRADYRNKTAHISHIARLHSLSCSCTWSRGCFRSIQRTRKQNCFRLCPGKHISCTVSFVWDCHNSLFCIVRNFPLRRFLGNQSKRPSHYTLCSNHCSDIFDKTASWSSPVSIRGTSYPQNSPGNSIDQCASHMTHRMNKCCSCTLKLENGIT